MPVPIYNKVRDLGPFPDTIAYRLQDGQRKDVLGRRRGVQLTASTGNPWYPKKNRPDGDIGGDFTSIKIEVQTHGLSMVHVPNTGGGLPHYISGPVVPTGIQQIGGQNFDPFNFTRKTLPNGLGVSFDMFPDLSSSDSFLMAQGTVAVDRCSPVNSVSAIATTLGELRRDGLPSLPGTQIWKDRLKPPSAKKGSEEYLNYQFGVAPLVSDIQNFAKAATQSSKILSQLERDSGRLVRRRYEFPLETTVERASRVGATSPLLYTGCYDFGSGGLENYTTRTVTKRRWFSGAFTYYVPSGDSVISRVARGYQEFDKLFGGLDAETIWNLTPWSWATDWFFNTGSVISNLTDAASFGLVMPYGYIMEETSVRYDVIGIKSRIRYDSHSDFPLSVVHTTKKRRKATPFGFGLTWDGFSPYQLSILAALGITRRHSM